MIMNNIILERTKAGCHGGPVATSGAGSHSGQCEVTFNVKGEGSNKIGKRRAHRVKGSCDGAGDKRTQDG